MEAVSAMPTIRELADEFNMNPAELREWFPWEFDPADADDTCVTADTLSEVRRALGPSLPTYLGD